MAASRREWERSVSAPIGHTFFAHRAFQKRLPGINLRAFIVGTHLPDIRTLSGHPREHTHSYFLDFESVLSAEDHFEMGYRLHSFVDALHWQVFTDHGKEDYFYGDRVIATAWKIVEDEILHPRVPEMKPVILFFEDILEDELRYGIEEAHIDTWHSYMRDYLRQRPTPDMTIRRLQALGVVDDKAEAIAVRAEKFRKDADLPRYIDEVISRFDAALVV